MRVAVVGGGIVGLATASRLAADGHDVTVVERHAEVAAESSFANGGQLCYSYIAPFAAPGMPRKLAASAFDSGASVRWRPRLSPGQWRWGAAFLKACTAESAAAATGVLAELALLSRAELAGLVRQAGADGAFDYRVSGKLVVHTDAATLAAAIGQARSMRAHGLDQEPVDAERCIAIEPALAPSRDRIRGGIWSATDALGDCRALAQALATALGSRRLSSGVDAQAIEISDGSVVGLRTSGGRIAADAIVIATGVSAIRLLRPIGIDVPIQPLRGYSLSTTPEHGMPMLGVSVTDFANKVVYAPLGRTLRIAGLGELDDADTTPDPRRVGLLRRQAAALFPQYAESLQSARAWCGLRPATPDGVPRIGPTAVRGLLLNVGHGGLGFTLAAGAARLIADALGGRAPALSPGAIGRLGCASR